MSMYYERSVVDEFPGAGVIIPGDLGAGDCANFDSLQKLVKELTSGAGGVTPTTIVGGLAYTEGSMVYLAAACTV